MDKKRRRKKGGKANNNARPQSPVKVSTFDTTGLSGELACCFTEADDLIQSRFNTLTKQEAFLQAAKDQTLREIDGSFDKVIQIATRRKQLLRGEVADIYSNQLEDTLEKKENVLLSGMFLETLLRQAKDMASVPQGEKVGFEDMIHHEIDRHCSTASDALPLRNLMDFDKTTELLEPIERKLRMVGKVRTANNLPATAVLKDCKAMAGLSSNLELQILDAIGETLPQSLVKLGRISLQLKDSHDELVHYRLKDMEDNTIKLTFTPTHADSHTLVILFCGYVVKELEITVKENSPTLVFGDEDGLVQPNAICAMKDGLVCVADSASGKLVLFSKEGAMLAETSFSDGSFAPFDITTDLKRNYILCTGSVFDDQDDTLSASPEDSECLFPPEMTVDKLSDSCSNLSKKNDNTDTKTMCKGENVAPDTEDLKISETTIENIRVKYIEKRGYITLTSRNQIIIGEVNSNTVLVYDIEGHFLRVVSIPTLDCLGSVQCKLDGQIIVSDIGHCTMLAGTAESGLCERLGSVETESKQLLLPLGLAIDETGNLMVADGGGPRVFIYGEYGEFLTCLHLAPPAVDQSSQDEGTSEACRCPSTSKRAKVSVIPWDITVVGSSIWIIDNNSHKVLRYSYTPPS